MAYFFIRHAFSLPTKLLSCLLSQQFFAAASLKTRQPKYYLDNRHSSGVASAETDLAISRVQLQKIAVAVACIDLAESDSRSRMEAARPLAVIPASPDN